jgi:hypothetical protein
MSGNPFESDDSPNDHFAENGTNPFGEDDDSEEEIVIPSLDQDLDRDISNPFSKSETSNLKNIQEHDTIGMLDDETTALIENVNLTYR